MVDLATKTLLHDKVRFLITVSGVAFAVMLIMVQVGLFMGLLDNASTSIDHIDADLWVTSRNTPNVDFAHEFNEGKVHRVRSIPGVADADNLIVSFMNVALPTGAQEGILVYALQDFAKWKLPWNLVGGNVDDLRRGRYMILDESASARFGAFSVGDYREVLGQRVQIIGTTRDAKSFTTTPIAFMDYHLVQRLFPSVLDGNTHYIVVKLAPGANAEQVRAEIKRRLPYNDVYSRTEWAQRSRTYWVANTGIGINMYMTVGLGCLVGIVVVAQTLYTSTIEHIKEFGTLKAIGGSNADIYGILARQASVAAVVGFALGALPSYLLRPLIKKVGMQLILSDQLAVSVFVGTVVLCLVASMISFRKVAGIDPGLVFRA